MPEDLFSRQSPSSEVGSGSNSALQNMQDEEKDDSTQVHIPLQMWREMLNSQHQNLLQMMQTIQPSTNSISSQVFLPEFDPDKVDTDAKAWCATVDMIFNEKSLAGGALVMALSRAFKGSASRWLPQVSFPGMQWIQFKDIFLAKFVGDETPASALMNVLSSRPADRECYGAYAGRILSSLCTSWHKLNIEEVAVATVLAHMSQFDSRIQRLVFTADINSRDTLLKEMKAISFLKRPNNAAPAFDSKRPRLTPLLSKCSICQRTNHKAEACYFRQPSTPAPTMPPARSPAPATARNHPTCYRCGRVGHVQANCRMNAKESQAMESGTERRIDFCEANPTGSLTHKGNAPGTGEGSLLRFELVCFRRTSFAVRWRENIARMETDGTFSSEPSSSQARGPDVESPIFPSAIFDYAVTSWGVRERLNLYKTLSRPYGQDECHPKGENSHTKTRASQRYMSDFKKSLEERRLVQAASFNDVAKVNNLLNRGVNPNCSDSLSRTPLHVAACKGYGGIVRMLLERGANPNSRDSIGNTALHLAACTNNIDVVLLLLKAGTDACCSDILGRSPLQLAQSKLKILQRAKFPNEEIKKQVSMVIEMLLHFSKTSKQSNDVEALDLELLSTFQSRFKLTETRQDIDAQLTDLLDNLGSLTIKPA
ncbi:hypothetical protein GE061_003785 [Apolygus lucorum]|uniref:CCHC-type domain-containing protein n=1 Tax=Apolygus lucorum TaxID=248454 RepID=A0A8S9X5M6_APOLU|nr:hypothetical protein GE061_003785 [Apolygus lucorum]